ncbi:MAG: hypothetical protein ACKVW3_10680 [Phycisphaerales bacterium]
MEPAARTDYERTLRIMFDSAQAQGESFLDVTAGNLLKAVAGPKPGSKGLSACRRVMRRMMIPGDYDLSGLNGPTATTLLIRFRLPR